MVFLRTRRYFASSIDVSIISASRSSTSLSMKRFIDELFFLLALTFIFGGTLMPQIFAWFDAIPGNRECAFTAPRMRDQTLL